MGDICMWGSWKPFKIFLMSVVVLEWRWGVAVMFLYNDNVLGNDFSYRLYMNKAFISKSGQRCGLRMALTC